MYKPGQIFTYAGNIYRISKKCPIGSDNSCTQCGRYYKEHCIQNGYSSKVPCLVNAEFHCAKYCGMNSFPQKIYPAKG